MKTIKRLEDQSREGTQGKGQGQRHEAVNHQAGGNEEEDQVRGNNRGVGRTKPQQKINPHNKLKVLYANV